MCCQIKSEVYNTVVCITVTEGKDGYLILIPFQINISIQFRYSTKYSLKLTENTDFNERSKCISLNRKKHAYLYNGLPRFILDQNITTRYP